MKDSNWVEKKSARRAAGLPDIVAVTPHVRTPHMGSRYQITDGRYKGRSCRVLKLIGSTDKPFAEVVLLDAFGKDTKEHDALPWRVIGF